MFNNIGAKIKFLATILYYVGTGISILIGLIMIFNGLSDIEYNGYFIFLGLLTGVIGWLLSWVSVIILYGFGELVENSAKINHKVSLLTKENHQVLKHENNHVVNEKNEVDPVKLKKIKQLEDLFAKNLITKEEFDLSIKNINNQENE